MKRKMILATVAFVAVFSILFVGHKYNEKKNKHSEYKIEVDDIAHREHLRYEFEYLRMMSYALQDELTPEEEQKQIDVMKSELKAHAAKHSRHCFGI